MEFGQTGISVESRIGVVKQSHRWTVIMGAGYNRHGSSRVGLGSPSPSKIVRFHLRDQCIYNFSLLGLYFFPEQNVCGVGNGTNMATPINTFSSCMQPFFDLIKEKLNLSFQVSESLYYIHPHSFNPLKKKQRSMEISYFSQSKLSIYVSFRS